MANGRNLVTSADRSKFASMGMDLNAMQAALDKLGGDLPVRLARSMGVAGGEVIRDEAQIRVPQKSGLLASAIYLVFRDVQSNDKSVTYSVSWNRKKAPHGHLVEFGHVQLYRVRYNEAKGIFWSDKRSPLPTPRYVPGVGFLRGAFEAKKAQAQQEMLTRARERFPELMAEAEGAGDGNA